MASSDGQFCAHHSDNCERLARLEINQEGLRRDMNSVIDTQRETAAGIAQSNSKLVQQIIDSNKAQLKMLAGIVAAASGLISGVVAILANMLK